MGCFPILSSVNCFEQFGPYLFRTSIITRVNLTYRVETPLYFIFAQIVTGELVYEPKQEQVSIEGEKLDAVNTKVIVYM